MTPTELIKQVTKAWEADEHSSVVWTGEFEGRWGLRMSQQCRDFTTVWFEIGDKTVGFSAYLLPPPLYNTTAALALCLKRNFKSWPSTIAADDRGELYIKGRIGVEALAEHSIEVAVGSIYELVELTFRPLLALGYTKLPPHPRRQDSPL